MQHTFAYFDEKGRLVRICVNDHEKGRDSATSPVPAGTPSPEGCTESPSALDKAPRKTRGACDGSPGPPLSAPPDPAPSASALPLSPRSTTSSSRSSSCSSSSSSSSSCAGTGSGSKSGGQQVYRGDAPLPRLHGHLVVRGSSLLLYGGLIELDDKEVTLDDCWTLNLSKRQVYRDWELSSRRGWLTRTEAVSGLRVKRAPSDLLSAVRRVRASSTGSGHVCKGCG